MLHIYAFSFSFFCEIIRIKDYYLDDKLMELCISTYNLWLKKKIFVLKEIRKRG